MADIKLLNEMINTKPECELGYSVCEGIATEHDTHPTGVALGDEDSWLTVWFCSPCGWEAMRDS
jgi:hypothetical protein